LIGLRHLPRRLRLRLVIKKVKPYTLVSPQRLVNLFELAQRVEREQIPGDVVECGVCNGGSAAVLAHVVAGSRMTRKVWLFDSFQGMPRPTIEDGKAADAYEGKDVGDIKKVKTVLNKVGADMGSIRIIAGWYQQTFASVDIDKIALLNLDADWYESLKLCLERFYDHVVTGGFISIDDYGYWPGCRRAVDEFLKTRGIADSLKRVDETARWFQKV
jgi:O-methyltransferase